MKKLAILIIVLSLGTLCFANPAVEESEKKRYVASTSWVASIAQLAGLDEITLIAPANLKHPPEYEITPDDVYKIANADLFMHAGYERMMKTISTAAEVSKDKILKVKTTNTLENLNNMTTMLSEKAGTQEKAIANFSKLEKLILNARKRIAESPNRDTEVYSNVSHSQFAEDIGLNVVSTFGTGQLTSDQIALASEKKYKLVIDNTHAPVAAPIEVVSPDSIIISFSNFPSHLEKDALYNVLKNNLDLLWSTGIF